jgi:hypothetical protein
MSDVPNGPVDTVDEVHLTGARVMRGTWPDGETAVLIHSVLPYEPMDARIALKSEEIDA